MIPGAYTIIACPECRAIARMPYSECVLFLGVDTWTDGFTPEPEKPISSSFTRCSGCSAFFWVEDADRLGRLYTFSQTEPVEAAWKAARTIRVCTADEIISFLEGAHDLDLTRERYLRREAWWRGNDAFRQAANRTPMLSGRERSSLSRLFDMLVELNFEEEVARVEVAIQLGRFAEARGLLTNIRSPLPHWTRDNWCTARGFLLGLIEARSRKLAVIPAPLPHVAPAQTPAELDLVPSEDHPPCPCCQHPLRTKAARQCFECGADWHWSP